MRALAAGLVITLAAGAASAQGMCMTDSGDVPPCMVGDWIGESNAHDLLDFALSLLPEEVRAAALPPTGMGEFLRIAEDGWYAHMAVPAEAMIQFQADGELTEPLYMVFDTEPATGYFIALADGTLKGCTASGGGGFLTTSGGEHTMGQAIPAEGGITEVPMRYTCGPGTLRLAIELPGDFGTLQIDMARTDVLGESDLLPEHP